MCLVIDNFVYVPSNALPLYQILKQSDNCLYGDNIAFKRSGGYRKCRHECSVGVNLVIDDSCYVASDVLPTLYALHLKAIGQLLIYILHFKDVGDTECRLAANAVVLVLG